MSALSIAAIICTHNRANYLGLAIDSLLKQDYTNYEIIIVDNASSDNTRQIVESRLHDSRLKYIYEPNLGLSIARNTGYKNTKADIIAYLDDDAIASTHWLTILAQAYQKNDLLAIAGGKVTLIFPPDIDIPSWLSRELMGNLGAYDLGEEIINIQQANLTPRGLNYSIRRSFLETVGGFNTNLGRVGKNLLSNEELYMTEIALKKGWQIAYLPQALVAHHVTPERLKKSWFYQRSWWQGISEAYRDNLSRVSFISQLNQGIERLIRGAYKSLKPCQNPFDHLVYTYGQIAYLKTVIKNRITNSK